MGSGEKWHSPAGLEPDNHCSAGRRLKHFGHGEPGGEAMLPIALRNNFDISFLFEFCCIHGQGPWANAPIVFKIRVSR
ncbi:unnamed protein product, partial [Nesidiocoris tenuis]